MKDWVTDPDALVTLLRLDTLRKGDEVRLCKQMSFGISNGNAAVMRGTNVVIDEVLPVPAHPEAWEPHPTGQQFYTGKWNRYAICTSVYKGDEYFIAPFNIKAWRRP